MTAALIVFFARYLFFIICAGVLCWLWKTRKSVRASVGIFLPAVFNWTFVLNGLHLFLWSPRPFVVLHTTPLVWITQYEWYRSFPSGHMMFLFSLATSMFFADKRLGTALFVGSALVGIGRVLALAHWPIDIVVGAMLGIVLTFLEMRLLTKRIMLR